MNTLLVVSFLVVIALGAMTAVKSVRQARPVVTLASVHGLAAAAALALLGYRVFTGPENLWFNSAFFLFVLALIGGLFMLLVRRPQEPPFVALIVLHATAAIVAFLVLLGGLSGT